MKDSRIEWIGEIPEDWKTMRIQFCLNEIVVKNDPIQTTQVLSLVKDKGVMLYEEKGDMGNKAKEDCSEYKIAYPHTLIVNSMNILIGSVGISNYFGCVSPVYYVFKETALSDLRFINYIFNTAAFQKELRRYANGILEIRLRVSADDIFKCKIPLPKKSIQAKIADFLDDKCAKIDSLITHEEATIEELKAYKQLVITESVTKGLDKTIPMKDSGVEWIGKIPENWDIKPTKTLFSFGKGLPITKADLRQSGVKAISYGQIHAKYNKSVTVVDDLYRFVDEQYLETNASSIVERGDFIFADTSEDVEGAGDFIYIDKDDVIFAGYHSLVLKSKQKRNNKYLAYLFMSSLWKNQIRSKVCGVKVFSISRTTVSQTTVLLPSQEEQQQIIEYLDHKCSNIDELISIKQQKIEELKEYKKSLIYEYVTGKKEVV